MAPNVSHQDSAKKQPIALSTPLQPSATKECAVPAGNTSKEAYWAEQELQKKSDYVFSANHVTANAIRASEQVEESVVNNANLCPNSYWEEQESTNVGDSQA